MMRQVCTWLLILVTATTMSACCGSVECSCDDSFDDALYFRFKLTDSLGTTGFRTQDVDTVFFVRYPFVDTLVQAPPGTPPARPDTARIIRIPALVDSLFILNNNAPFTAGGTRKLNAYKYQLFVVRRFPEGTSPRRDTLFYALDKLQLDGRFVGDGCCSCYENQGKRLRVSQGKIPNTNGSVLDVKPTTGTAPVPIVLARYR